MAPNTNASAVNGAEEGQDTSEAETRRAGLNNKPAWMSRGIGVNKEIFGEVKGDLIKPGLTKADLERLENTKPSGPDPFGDVFRENVKLEDGKEATSPAVSPVMPSGVLPKASSSPTNVVPPWRRNEAPAPPPGTMGKAKGSAPQDPRLAPSQAKGIGGVPFKAPAGARVKAPAMASASAKMPAMAAASAKAPHMAAASAKMLPAEPPVSSSDVAASEPAVNQAQEDEDEDYDPFTTMPEEGEDDVEYDPFSTVPADAPEAAATTADVSRAAQSGNVETVPGAAAMGVAARAFLSGAEAKYPMPFKAPPPKAPGEPDYLGGLIAAAKAESARTLEKIRAMSKQLAAQSPPPPPPKAAQGTRRPHAAPEGDRAVRPKLGVSPKAGVAEGKPDAAEETAASEKAVAADAASWLAAPGGRRLETAAALAQEYFVHSKKDKEIPAAKRSKVASAPVDEKSKQVAPAAAPIVSFAPELLEKAPTSIQTCRSLLLFLDKKLEAPLEPAPSVEGPKDMHSRLEKHAEGVGRAAALHATSGWDSRAKRIINIVGAVSSSAGGAALKAFEKQLGETAAKLEKDLKDHGGLILEPLIKKRSAWAQECMRREWLVWCGRLLRMQEAALLKAVDGEEDSQAAKKDGVGYAGIVEALLTGEGGLSPSCAGG